MPSPAEFQRFSASSLFTKATQYDTVFAVCQYVTAVRQNIPRLHFCRPSSRPLTVLATRLAMRPPASLAVGPSGMNGTEVSVTPPMRAFGFGSFSFTRRHRPSFPRRYFNSGKGEIGTPKTELFINQVSSSLPDYFRPSPPSGMDAPVIFSSFTSQGVQVVR